MTAPITSAEEGAKHPVLRCACSQVVFPKSLPVGVTWACPCGRSTLISNDHRAEMEAGCDVVRRRTHEANFQAITRWLADQMCRAEEPLIGSFMNSLSVEGARRLNALIEEADQAFMIRTLNMSEGELRAEIVSEGRDPDQIVADMRREVSAAIKLVRERDGALDDAREWHIEYKQARREANEAEARATAAESEVSRLTERLAKVEAERDEARRKAMPHMCRDDHAEIRHAVSDDDERCPVCRERHRADLAEDEVERLQIAIERERERSRKDMQLQIPIIARAEAAESTASSLAERVKSLEAALERIAGSNTFDMNSLHPDSCARVARAALKEASDD